jgi:hypothetical protein
MAARFQGAVASPGFPRIERARSWPAQAPRLAASAHALCPGPPRGSAHPLTPEPILAHQRAHSSCDAARKRALAGCSGCEGVGVTRGRARERRRVGYLTAQRVERRRSARRWRDGGAAGAVSDLLCGWGLGVVLLGVLALVAHRAGAGLSGSVGPLAGIVLAGPVVNVGLPAFWYRRGWASWRPTVDRSPRQRPVLGRDLRPTGRRSTAAPDRRRRELRNSSGRTTVPAEEPRWAKTRWLPSPPSSGPVRRRTWRAR